jgi:hypothetical protein
VNANNPIEIGFLILIGLLSIFLFERIVSKAFKTFIFGSILLVVLLIYGSQNFTDKKKDLPTLEFKDILNWPVLKTKLVPYQQEALKDLKISYKEAKKNF